MQHRHRSCSKRAAWQQSNIAHAAATAPTHKRTHHRSALRNNPNSRCRMEHNRATGLSRHYAGHERRLRDSCSCKRARPAGSKRDNGGVRWMPDKIYQQHHQQNCAIHESRVCSTCNRHGARPAGCMRDHGGVRSVGGECDQQYHERDDAGHERRVRDCCGCKCVRSAFCKREHHAVRSVAGECDQ